MPPDVLKLEAWGRRGSTGWALGLDAGRLARVAVSTWLLNLVQLATFEGIGKSLKPIIDHTYIHTQKEQPWTPN